MGASTSWLFVMWAGGGNVNPFLGLAHQLRGRGDRVSAVASAVLVERLAADGIEVVASPEAWLPEADHVLAAVAAASPDALVVDYMLTSALCGAQRAGLPTVALVHTLYRQLLVDGAPHPMAMAAPVEALNHTRAALGLPPIAGYGELLAATDLVLVAAPRELDAPGEVPLNVAYAGPLFEEPGPDQDWQPPPGADPLIVVSTGTAGDPEVETGLLQRLGAALAGLPVRGFVTVPDYIDPGRLEPPVNVVLSGYVRHAAVLLHADLMVTHAGLGTVVAALAHGVPMVCVPLCREQPDNARAVERVGAGVTLSPDASPETLRKAIADQLTRRHAEPVRYEATPERAVDLVRSVLAGT